jgi:hypothetical protein
MLDFTRYFNFNFDVIRPECTVDYTPLTKLLFVLIGPMACALFIVMLVSIYTMFKCFRISKILQAECVRIIHNKGFLETAFSVAQCLFTTSFCLKFSNSRMMVDGALWNALSPTLVMRTNTQVLQQKVRRRTAVANHSLNDTNPSAKTNATPEDWIQMQVAMAHTDAELEFARSAKRFRLLVASAMSIFILTYQSSLESMFSTFDCRTQSDMMFLRSNPKIKCSLDDAMYLSMVAASIAGIFLNCVLIPTMIFVTLRSNWSREIYVHDSAAYDQIFGFFTSMYSKTCMFWELVSCLRKMTFVAVPVIVSAEILAQCVSIFFCIIVYTLFFLKMQPMACSTYNQIELLSCVNLIAGCFSSIFFVVEYKGSLVLTGASRDSAGLMLVISFTLSMLLSFNLIWKDFSSTPCCTRYALIHAFK